MLNIDYFNKDLNLILESAIGVVVIFTLILLYTRIFGLKSFSKMTGFDFVNTIIIGNVSAMSLSTGKPGLWMGAIIIALVYILNYIITLTRYKSEKIEDLIANQPVLLMRDGKMIKKNMRECKVTEDEIRGKLREANVLQLSQAKAVILETTGDVSVLHSDKDIEIDQFLLTGIKT